MRRARRRTGASAALVLEDPRRDDRGGSLPHRRPALADEGERRIRWVAQHIPVLNRLARGRLAGGRLGGRRVAVVVHLEAKTAYLATLFADAGAHVVAGSNPQTTQDEVAAALVGRGI